MVDVVVDERSVECIELKDMSRPNLWNRGANIREVGSDHSSGTFLYFYLSISILIVTQDQSFFGGEKKYDQLNLVSTIKTYRSLDLILKLTSFSFFNPLVRCSDLLRRVKNWNACLDSRTTESQNYHHRSSPILNKAHSLVWAHFIDLLYDKMDVMSK